MTTSELVQRIKSAGFFPIQVELFADSNESVGFKFVGGLEDFFEAAKAMGVTTLFVFVCKLEEEDFLHDSDYEDDDEELIGRSEKESLDLTVALPSLANFKKHIGHECEFRLTAKSSSASICLCLTEDWWDSFEEQRDKAKAKFDEDREAMREKAEKQRQQKEEALLKQIRNLLNDPEFSRIPTQRGMKAYALEKFPELEEVDESSLIEEIRKLDDKIKARKRK